MKNTIITCFFLTLSFVSYGQSAPNFTITTHDGNTHTLYDYLDQGHSVVLDIMFVNCIHCQTFSPYLENLYQDWGAGNADVQFFSVSPYDVNTQIATFDNTYGVTYPGAGTDGGSQDVIDTYWDPASPFGEFSSFPTIIIIAPDRSVNFDVKGANNQATIDLMAEIFATNGATGQVATCSDGIQNGNETGIDCGGTCTACNTDCNPPMPSANVISGKCVKLDWTDEPGIEKYKVRYRLLDGSWINYNAKFSQTFFNNLEPNTTYEYQVKTDCGSSNSVWTNTAYFTTANDVCDRPSTITHSNVTAVTADLNWTTTPDDLRYKIGYKGASGNWIQVFVNIPNLDFTLSSLQAGNNYFYRLKTKCFNGWTNWTPKSTFMTTPILAREVKPQWDTAVYPNPAKESLSIQYKVETTSTTTIQVFDIIGKVILTKQIDNNPGLNTFQLDISQLHTGNHLISIQNAESKVIKKFVKL